MPLLELRFKNVWLCVRHTPQIVALCAVLHRPLDRRPLHNIGRHPIAFFIRRCAIKIIGILATAESHHARQITARVRSQQQYAAFTSRKQIERHLIISGVVYAEFVTFTRLRHERVKTCDISAGALAHDHFIFCA